jgi:multisubunit Na+/H+ antiporter MnhF subunit
VIGLIFFHFAAFGCNTFKSNYYSYYGFFYDSIEVNLGYWKYSNGGSCVDYLVDGSDFEGVWRFGRFVGVFGSLLIWVMLAFVLAASVVRFPRPTLVFRVVGGCMLFLSLLSFLLLVGLATDKNLKLSAGAVLAILSAFLWFGGAISVICFMKERPRGAQPARAGAGGTAAAPAAASAKPDPIAEETTGPGEDSEAGDVQEKGAAE